MNRLLFYTLMVVSGTLLLLLSTTSFSQEAAKDPSSELVIGRLIYVSPMPGNLDRWIVDFLRRWGKYTVTGDPEGVDLVWDVNRPGTEIMFKKDRRGLPVPKKRDNKVRNSISLTITDWVTGEPLWHVVFSNKKRRKKDPPQPTGPSITVSTRKLSAEQLAERVVRRLRQYVKQLEGGGPPPSSTIQEEESH